MFDLRMYNVGFGDCFLFEDPTSMFLVDCGTISMKSSPFSNLKDVVKLLLNEFNTSKKKIGLISHFHKDHYGGFKIMAKNNHKVFDKMYVPYMYFNEKGQCILVDLAIYILMTLAPNSHAYAAAKNILNHVADLMKIVDGYDIVSLSKGMKIDFGASETFDVLWPPKDDDYIDQQLKSFLEYLNKNTKEEKEFHMLKDKIMANMKLWMEIISRDQNEDSQDNFKINQRLENINSIQKDLLNQIQIMRKKEILTAEMRNQIKQHSKIFLKNNHMLNIVFHNIRFLMLGDIEPKVINNYLAKLLKTQYYAIKAPHHGTKSHYLKLPYASFVLISIGARGHRWKIYKDYYLQYGYKVCSGGKYCCEILDAGCSCGGQCWTCCVKV